MFRNLGGTTSAKDVSQFLVSPVIISGESIGHPVEFPWEPLSITFKSIFEGSGCIISANFQSYSGLDAVTFIFFEVRFSQPAFRG